MARVIRVKSLFSSAIFRATFRQIDAISRSRFLNPASLVYSAMIRNTASSENSRYLVEMPLLSSCLGSGYLLAISSFYYLVKTVCWLSNVSYKMAYVIDSYTVTDETNKTLH